MGGDPSVLFKRPRVRQGKRRESPSGHGRVLRVLRGRRKKTSEMAVRREEGRRGCRPWWAEEGDSSV